MAKGGKAPKSSELRDLIGRRLAAARAAYEPNARAFSAALEIDPRVLWKYENGLTFPDEMFIVRFCALTGCTADWLILGRITEEMSAQMAARIAVLAPELLDLASVPSRRSAAGREKTPA